MFGTVRMFMLCALALGMVEAAGVAQAAEPPTNEALEQLVKNARYWQERGRADKVVEAWGRVLAADPDHPDALAELGALHARRGRVERAREYLARLRAAHPQHPGVARLEQALATGGNFDTLVARARQLVRNGAIAEAIATYRQAFGSNTPPSDLALEYYQTLGGSPDGWEEAREGLEALAARARRNGPARLALAKHLTYREKTRRRGIALLQELAIDGPAGDDARKAWRQALEWLQATGADAGLFTAYLARHPRDEALGKRLEELRRTSAQRALPALNLKPGYEALERGDLGEAEKVFGAAARSRPRDPDVLVGLGLLALKQEDFPKAREIFLKVKELLPGKPESWKRSLESATFWALMREAETLRRERKLEEAERKLAEAATASPEDRLHADLALAEVKIERTAVDDAEALYRQILEGQPDSVPALQGLIRLFLATERSEEAATVNAELVRIDAKQAFRPEEIESEVLRWQAANARKLGDLEEARAALLTAKAADPRNAWVLHDLAYVQVEMDDVAAARATVDELAAVAPEAPGLTLLRARLLDSEGHHREAIGLIDSLPKNQQDEGTRATRARLDVQATAAEIVARARRGAIAGSRLRMVELQRRASKSPELSALVALAWADIGEAERAIALAAEVKRRAPRSSPGLRLTLAAVYLRAGRDDDLETQLREIAAEPSLSPRERRDLARLRIAHAVRGADRLRELGELEGAMGRLAPMLQDHPDDPRLLCGLGRVFHDARESSEAYNLFQRVLRDNPDDLEARQGAIQSALGMHNRAVARRLIDEGLARDPESARMHLIAGRFAVQTGADGEAMAAFQRARSLADKHLAAAGAPRLAPNFMTNALLRRTASAKVKATDGDTQLPLEIQAEIDRLEAKQNMDVGAEFELRSRRGYGGFGGITDLRVPIGGNIPLGFRGRLGFTVVPTMLDAGNVSRAEVVEQFGLLGLDPTRVPDGGLSPTGGGASVSLSYAHKGLAADVGTTPLGLPLATVVGGLSLRHQMGRFGLAGEAFRRSVTDTVLSYVGAREPVTGRHWGRVLRQGARLDVGVNTDVALLYAIGSYALLTGKHVPENQMYMLGGGTEWKLHERDSTSVISGVGMTYLSYDRNLRHATYGHGGYFSPQQFFHAGALFKWRGETGNLRFDTNADIGVNWFREEAAAYYPRDPRLQAARAALADPMGMPLRAWHPGQTSVALAVDATARGGYRVSRQLEAGFQLAFRRAEWFQELVAGAYVRVAFRGRSVARTTEF